MRFANLAISAIAVAAFCGLAAPTSVSAQSASQIRIKIASGTAFAETKGEAISRAKDILKANATNQCGGRGWTSVGDVDTTVSRPAGPRNELWVIELKMKVRCN